jgi:hypothetical protein
MTVRVTQGKKGAGPFGGASKEDFLEKEPLRQRSGDKKRTKIRLHRKIWGKSFPTMNTKGQG